MERSASPSSLDVQHVSDTCDGLSTATESFQAKLKDITAQVEAVSKSIDDATTYSYQ